MSKKDQTAKDIQVDINSKINELKGMAVSAVSYSLINNRWTVTYVRSESEIKELKKNSYYWTGPSKTGRVTGTTLEDTIGNVKSRLHNLSSVIASKAKAEAEAAMKEAQELAKVAEEKRLEALELIKKSEAMT